MVTRFEPNARQRSIIEHAEAEADTVMLTKHYPPDELVNRMTLEFQASTTASNVLCEAEFSSKFDRFQRSFSRWKRCFRTCCVKAFRQLRRCGR